MNLLTGIESIGKQRWDSFLASNEYASPFQSPAYLEFFNSVQMPQEAQVYAVESRGQINALCLITLQKEIGIKGYFSRRAIIYGGPLVQKQEPDAWRVLLHAIENDLSRKAIYLEVRNYHDYQPFFPIYEAAGWQYLPYMNVHIPLHNRSLDDVMTEMKYNRRREIRQSQQEGAICRLAENEEEVRELYGLLRTLYQERVKLPLPAYDYFRRLFLSPFGQVLLVQHGKKVIGGAFCASLEGQNIYTLYYCGLRNYHPRIYPTHLAILGAIQYGLEKKLEGLDFMGAGLRDKEYGVRDYKMAFGGQLREPGRFLKITNPILFSIGKLGLQLLAKQH